MEVNITNNRREAMNSNINFMIGSTLPTGKLATLSKAKGRIFYVGEGAEKLARSIAANSKYKTIYQTWYGVIGSKVTQMEVVG
ncbi:hypothetical protein [Tenacibaculum sediminilitoris]|uniref:hypothetical protein n=1 Tax=Tenacibaculum sediminilitoris TaxID=1820334 RepID=UPI0038B606B7